MWRTAGWLMALSVWFMPSKLLTAETLPARASIWDIHLGDEAAGIPDDYVNYACGTNGGPPSIALVSFAGFRKCKPDGDGLHEVYFEYDDELEYRARALGNRDEIRLYGGTTIFEFPIVASVLFDDAGRVRAERMVTDPRQQVTRDRLEFFELGTFLRQRFGEDQWSCQDLPAAEGESAAGSLFIKNHCEKTVAEAKLVVEQRFLQKKGQQFLDPQSGKASPMAFDSVTRFEIYDAALPSRRAALN